MEESENKKAFHPHTALERAYWLLEQRDYTEKGLTEKLKEKYPPQEAEEAVSVCVARGFVNDRRYGEVLCRRYREKYGYLRVMTALIQKGISPALAQELVSLSAEEEEDSEADGRILGEVRKKMKGEPVTRENRSKLSAFLARKGYTPSEISHAIKAYEDESDSESEETEIL